jgi:hypothetical protein
MKSVGWGKVLSHTQKNTERCHGWSGKKRSNRKQLDERNGS